MRGEGQHCTVGRHDSYNLLKEDVLTFKQIDIVAGQESWEKEDSRITVDGYKWFGKSRDVQNSQRGEGGVGFHVRDWSGVVGEGR